METHYSHLDPEQQAAISEAAQVVKELLQAYGAVNLEFAIEQAYNEEALPISPQKARWMLMLMTPERYFRIYDGADEPHEIFSRYGAEEPEWTAIAS